MYLTWLRVRNFRNIELVELDGLQRGTIVLAGANGAGKSTVLHAIRFLAGGPGAAGDQRVNAEKGEVTARFHLDESDVRYFKSRNVTDPPEELEISRPIGGGIQGQHAPLLFDRKRRQQDPGVGMVEYFDPDRRVRDLTATATLRESRSHKIERRDEWLLQNMDTKVEGVAAELANRMEEERAQIIQELKKAKRHEIDIDKINTTTSEEIISQHMKQLLPHIEQIIVPSLFEPNKQVRFRVGEGEILGPQLSSGEKETFVFIALLYMSGLRDSVVLIDEPDLHLPPSIQSQLLKTVRALCPDSQIWLATHSSQIAWDAGYEHLWHLRRSDAADPAIADANQARRVATTKEQYELLQDIFGSPALIPFGKRIVFVEGADDEFLLTQAFPSLEQTVSFRACGGTQRGEAALSLLEGDPGYSFFFMIRDRDWLDENQVKENEEKYKGHLRYWPCHEMENLILQHPDLLVEVSRELGGPVTQNFGSKQVQDKLAYVARRNLHTVVAMKLKDELARGIGHLRSAQARVNEANTKEALWADVETLSNRLGRLLSKDEFDKRWAQIEDALSHELKSASGTWKATFPGKEILQWYCSELGIRINEFRSSLANKASGYPDFIRMLEETVKKLTEFDPFSVAGAK